MVHNRSELGHVKEAGIDRVDRHCDTVPHTNRALGSTLLRGALADIDKGAFLQAITVHEIPSAMGIHHWATTVKALALQGLACHAVTVTQAATPEPHSPNEWVLLLLSTRSPAAELSLPRIAIDFHSRRR